MDRRLAAGLAVAAFVLAPGAALAGHGKAGLWNVTSTTNMGLSLPPDMARQMKAMGQAMPTSHTNTTQMCMSQEEVDASSPPHVDQSATGCTARVTSATPMSMTSETTCNGRMKGKGTTKITYTGNTRYAGSYDFNGMVEGNPTRMATTFKGEWVKADCGDIKPYRLRTQ